MMVQPRAAYLGADAALAPVRTAVRFALCHKLITLDRMEGE
jgi:hypothetical protein